MSIGGCVKSTQPERSVVSENSSALRRLMRHRTLTPLEESHLLIDMRRGSDEKRCAARETLIQSNMRLVLEIAGRYRTGPFPMEDLVQEGTVGLIEAADSFDISSRFRFATYAAVRIRAAICVAIGHRGRMVRLPNSLRRQLGAIDRIERTEGVERGLSPDELGPMIGTTAVRVSRMRIAAAPPVSLDAPAGPARSSLGAQLPAPSEVDPFATLARKEIEREIAELLSILTTRERSVIELRTGLAGGRPRTLAEIGAKLRLTRERVRQIELVAIRKLRTRAARLGELALG